MATITDSDLKELKDLITAGFNRLDGEIIGLKLNQEKLSGQVEAIEERLSGRIDNLDSKLSGRIDSLEERLSGRIDSLDNKLSGQMATLNEKLTGLDKRVENSEKRVDSVTGWLVGILFALVGGLLGLLGKFAFFPNP
jgi:archaellum component FlaC